jgi:hypothetical protein
MVLWRTNFTSSRDCALLLRSAPLHPGGQIGSHSRVVRRNTVWGTLRAPLGLRICSRRNKTFRFTIDLTSCLCYVLKAARPPVTTSKRTLTKSGSRKSVRLSTTEPAAKKTSTARPRSASPSQQRANAARVANGSAPPREERGVRRRPSPPELLSAGIRSSPDAHGGSRCIRLTHVAAACSVCGRFCTAAHLMGDKRARCAHCCPVCGPL